jgi:hypothetical protein
MSSISQLPLYSDPTKCLTPDLNIFLTTGNHTIMCLKPGHWRSDDGDGCSEPDDGDGCSEPDDGGGLFNKKFFKQFFDGIHEK